MQRAVSPTQRDFFRFSFRLIGIYFNHLLTEAPFLEMAYTVILLIKGEDDKRLGSHLVIHLDLNRRDR